MKRKSHKIKMNLYWLYDGNRAIEQERRWGKTRDTWWSKEARGRVPIQEVEKHEIFREFGFILYNIIYGIYGMMEIF